MNADAGVLELLDKEVERWRGLADSHRIDPDNREKNEQEALVYMSVALTLASLANVLREAEAA